MCLIYLHVTHLLKFQAIHKDAMQHIHRTQNINWVQKASGNYAVALNLIIKQYGSINGDEEHLSLPGLS